MSQDLRPEAWLFYVVCDVSESMQRAIEPDGTTAWDLTSRGLPEIVLAVDRSPTARDKAHICVVAFADDVRTVYPLTRMSDARSIAATGPMRDLYRGRWTNYEAVFEWLATEVPAAYDRVSQNYRVKRPAVYFITDGMPGTRSHPQPDSAWVPHLDRLKDHLSAPVITSLGLGNADEGTLAAIARKPGQAWVSEPGVGPGLVLRSIIKEIIWSVTRSAAQGEYTMEVPDGMRRAHPDR